MPIDTIGDDVRNVTVRQVPEARRSESDTKIAVSVIVPCYNEEGSIESTVYSIREALSDLGEYEIVFVDDGSTDGTGALLVELEQAIAEVRVVQHDRNRGYGAALKTGIRNCRASLIAITDADGTYPNDRLPDLIRLARKHDMVVGSRNGKNVRYPLIRKIPKWFLLRFAQWVANRKISDLNSGMRVFRKSVAERFLNILPDGFSFTTTITLATLTNGYRVHYEPIDYFSRMGRSKIKPIRDTLNFVQLILRTGMYFGPLRVFMPVATVFFLGFLVALAYDIFFIHNLTEKTLILLVAAAQLGMFALLADMIDKRSS